MRKEWLGISAIGLFVLIMLIVRTNNAVGQNSPVSDSVTVEKPVDHPSVQKKKPGDLLSKIPKASWTSIIPPLVAIAIALLFRQVLIALFLSIWVGAILVKGSSLIGIFTGFFSTITDYIVPAIADASHVSIILFSLLIGGMIGIISENGGTKGIIDVMTRYVKNRRGGQIMTAFLGFIVFFDDYANTMIVGNTMRPLTDKLRISRAKLAYLVDSTAAPVATIALVSTWIGAMVAYIADAEAAMPTYHEAAYLVFVNSLPYNFYAFLTVIFVLVIAFSGRDFGPMLKSRIDLLNAKHDPSLDKYNLWKKEIEEQEVSGIKSHFLNAAIPIIILVVGTIAGLFISGKGSSIQEIISSADSYAALLWGSLLAVVVASVMTVGQKLLSIEKTLESMMKGMHMMFDGLVILVLAWALSAITKDLHTADYLVSVFNDTLNPFWIPVLIFILSALTSFATGSSWGTMGILMPLVIPLMWNIGQLNGIEYATIHELIYSSVSSVLAGSVFGDHCSPISDTTILSSLASQCDHVEHVRTQLPYAIVVGGISTIALILDAVFEWPMWIIYPVAIALIVFVIFRFGKTTEGISDQLIEVGDGL